MHKSDDREEGTNLSKIALAKYSGSNLTREDKAVAASSLKPLSCILNIIYHEVDKPMGRPATMRRDTYAYIVYFFLQKIKYITETAVTSKTLENLSILEHEVVNHMILMLSVENSCNQQSAVLNSKRNRRDLQLHNAIS